MKNKALTGILIVVVGFIWYKAFFRVKDGLFGEETEVVVPTRNQPISFASLSRDTFSINLDYRDPFGETKKSYSPAPPQDARGSVNRAASRPIKQGVNWPEIVYYGQVRRTTSKDPLAIIGIDGYKHTLRRGEKLYDGILLKAIGRDSMVIVYQKEKRIFFRE
jgi:hypothetical protein